MKKKTYIPKSFESKVERPNEVYASLHKSLLESLAWSKLTKSQKLLYMYCKLQYHDEPPRGNPKFTMNKGKWHSKYKLYSEGNAASFYKDMGELIMHGFIDCVKQGYSSRTKNTYKLSDRWRLYGNPDYTVPKTVMTVYLIRHLNKKS